MINLLLNEFINSVGIQNVNSEKKGLSCARHIATPSVAQIPVFAIDELEVRQGEFLLQQIGELVLDGLGPLAHTASARRRRPCPPSAPCGLYLIVVS